MNLAWNEKYRTCKNNSYVIFVYPMERLNAMLFRYVAM